MTELLHTVQSDVSSLRSFLTLCDTITQSVDQLKSIERTVTQMSLTVSVLDKRMAAVEKTLQSSRARRSPEENLRRETSVTESQNTTQLMDLLRQQSQQLDLLTQENQSLHRQLNAISQQTRVLPLSSSTQRLLLHTPLDSLMFARYGDVFRAWLPADVRVVCRYHGREHGWAAAEFHARCNNCGPMLVVVLSAAGAVFGGYTSVGFSTSHGDSAFIPDDDSFLFVLKSPFYEECPKRFVGKRGLAGVTVSESFGPIFGSEREMSLVICDNCIENSSNMCGFPSGFDAVDVTNASINGDPYFLVCDIEVYSIASHVFNKHNAQV
ncbi:hypothetical protein WA538_005132 [Blastocystis sp. DL]